MANKLSRKLYWNLRFFLQNKNKGYLLDSKKSLNARIERLADEVSDLNKKLLEAEPSPILIERLEKALKMAEKYTNVNLPMSQDHIVAENQRLVSLVSPLLEKAKTEVLSVQEVSTFHRKARRVQESPNGN